MSTIKYLIAITFVTLSAGVACACQPSKNQEGSPSIDDKPVGESKPSGGPDKTGPADDPEFERKTRERLLRLRELRMKSFVKAVIASSGINGDPGELDLKISERCKESMRGLDSEQVLLAYASEAEIGLEMVYSTSRFDRDFQDLKFLIPSIDDTELRNILNTLQQMYAKRIWVNILTADLECILYLGNENSAKIRQMATSFCDEHWTEIVSSPSPWSPEVRLLLLKELRKELGAVDYELVRTLWFVNGLMDDGDK
jgi:hypothetical protein